MPFPFHVNDIRNKVRVVARGNTWSLADDMHFMGGYWSRDLRAWVFPIPGSLRDRDVLVRFMNLTAGDARYQVEWKVE